LATGDNADHHSRLVIQKLEGQQMSQEKDILGYLQRNGSISPLEALEQFGCFRLAARINDLRAKKHNIETYVGNENGKKFAIYRLINQ
jgi:hypothetical protein